MQEIDDVSNRSIYAGLPWPRLIKGTLVRRYKRFIADVRLKSGQIVAAHCPNSGSMLGCCEPGRPVYLSSSNNPKRIYKYTWEMIRMRTSLVGINTQVPNRLVEDAILKGQINSLSEYTKITREVRAGENSRLDLLLETARGEKCYIEVKNCTLIENGIAYFPDAKTTRGLKHLVTLQEQVRLGNRAVIFFLVQRTDARAFSPADHIDPEYGMELRKALRSGVEILCYDTLINLTRIAINKPLMHVM